MNSADRAQLAQLYAVVRTEVDSAERLVRMKEDSFLVSVHDEGVGVPADYDPTTSKRLGTRLVNALANQLGATLTRPSSVKGTHITLLVPLELPGSH